MAGGFARQLTRRVARTRRRAKRGFGVRRLDAALFSETPVTMHMGQSQTTRAASLVRLVALISISFAVVPVAAQAPAPQQETEFDPLKAEKNLEVGKYYLRRGNYDAAIDRLKDSIRYKSNYAEPHRLLGEAFEKKGEREQAIRYYKKYLQILPSAEDAERVRKRIEKLTKKVTGSGQSISLRRATNSLQVALPFLGGSHRL